MHVRAALLVLAVGSVAWAGSAGADPVVPLHEMTVSKAFTGTITSVVVNGDEGSIAVVAGRSAGLKAHERWNFQQPHVDYTLRHGTLTVSTNCEEMQQVADGVYVDGFNDCLVDLTLTVPAAADLKVSDPYGSVSVAGVSGTLRLHSDSGDVAVRDVSRGSVDATSGYGRVTADGISARQVHLHTDSGNVSLRSVHSAALSATSGYGDVTAEGVSAPRVTLHSDSGGVSGQAVRATELGASSGYGTVALSHVVAPHTQARSDSGAVRLSDLTSRTLQASSGYGDVTMAHTRATDVVAHSDSGKVDADLGTAPANASVTSSYGDVTLTVPTGRYAVSATSGYGDVKVEKLTVDGRSPRLLNVHSDSGNVLVQGS